MKQANHLSLSGIGCLKIFKHLMFGLVLAWLGISSSQATSLTGYLRNDTTQPISAYFSGDGAEFGGCGGMVSGIAPGATGSLNYATCVSTGVKITVTPGSGSTESQTNLCIKFSPISLADAKTRACGSFITPGLLGYNPGYAVVEKAILDCSAETVNWGPSGFCAGSAPNTTQGSSLALTNTKAGATGSATAACSNGTWAISNSTCVANLTAPLALDASDGLYPSYITVTWSPVSGSTSSDVQYRVEGSSTWTLASGVSTGWQLPVATINRYEFQVRAVNSAGVSDWSATELGYIQQPYMPLFVSQSVPTDVRAGATFSASQIWKNVGTMAWDTSAAQTIPASNSDNFGAIASTFQAAVQPGQSGVTNLTLSAPSTPGVYSLSRTFFRTRIIYGVPSTPVNIKVWGDPVCSALSTDKAFTYDINGVMGVKFNASPDVSNLTANVWYEPEGEASARSYVPVQSSGIYSFNIPLSDYVGYGTYHVKVAVSNVVATSTCEATFELRELAMPVASLTDIVGKGGDNEFVVGQSSTDPIIKATVTRAADLALSLQLFNDQGTVASSTLASGAASTTITGARWLADAWSKAPYTLRIQYADADAASQGKILDIPVNLILAPGGNTFRLTAGTTQPLIVTTTMGQVGGVPFNFAAQGDWSAMVAVQGGSDLDGFTAMGPTGQIQHSVSYDTIYGQTLVATARAMPSAGIVLRSPLEITSTIKLPVLPVQNIAATDGTLEDVVRVTWDAPAAGGVGFYYDIYRDNVLIASKATLRQFDDTPPVRGTMYSYSVMATLGTDKSTGASDTGYLSACRAARLIGASLNADMSAVNGLIERWECLTDLQITAAFDAVVPQDMPYIGDKVYRSFSLPVPLDLADGTHTVHLRLQSQGVTDHADRAYDIPVSVNRASITVNDLTILYDGVPATAGLHATSIGRFGIRMNGGSGIGFADEQK